MYLQNHSHSSFNLFLWLNSFEFWNVPSVPKFIRVLHYSSSFNSGAPHNSILNDIYNRSAVSPIFEWFEKGWNSFTIGIDLPEISVSSVYDAIYLLLYLNSSLEIECWFTSEFSIDLILEVTDDPVKVARELNKLIHLPIVVIELSYLLFQTYFRIKILFDLISIKFESLYMFWNLFLYRRARNCICKIIFKLF